MVKWIGKWLCYAKIPKFLVKGYKVVPKCLQVAFFSWWPLLLLQVFKSIMSKWHFQKISLKVKSKNKWLNMVLNLHFMTSNILNMDYFFIYSLNSWWTWGHHEKKCRKSLISCTFSLFWTNFFNFSKLSLHFQPLAPS
jgi:hypothetical protein